MRALLRIDRFYYVFGAILLVLAVLAIVSLRGIFSSVRLAGDIEESLLDSSLPRIDKEKVEKALDAISSREIQKLDLKR